MQQRNKSDVAYEHWERGVNSVDLNPVFWHLTKHIRLYRDQRLCPRDGWAVVTSDGSIYMPSERLATPGEWSYVYAHCLLHFGFGHFQEKHKAHWEEWNAACDCYIACFLDDFKFGTAPSELRGLLEHLGQLEATARRSEERLYDKFCEQGIPAGLFPSGTAGKTAIDMIWRPQVKKPGYNIVDWQTFFGDGLSDAASNAVQKVAANFNSSIDVTERPTEAMRARNWFVTHYPLLGALATSFKIIEDPLICHRMNVHVAAVHVGLREIYVNPRAGLNQHELRFVMAHELLHVGLRHDIRCGGRDPYLWNVACDYVINAWLKEMGVGEFPHTGGLLDEELKNESAEAIYDRIVTDLRRYRKLATMRGVGLSDILDEPGWSAVQEGTDLDDFYRSCMAQGLLLHESQGRGTLPSNLIEEIRALSYPPIPWDVELAQWFDHFFAPPEKFRSYARVSRRQSSTPDIPRPSWILRQGWDDARTFGVVLDTSSSMPRELLAKALGAIASYSVAHDVPMARVIFCDAAPYDQGYMAPEDIAGRVKVRGRGGTILQPGIDLLERAEDFPAKGPILIITDGMCDRLTIKREHAFLIPGYSRLPFNPFGPVFKMR